MEDELDAVILSDGGETAFDVGIAGNEIYVEHSFEEDDPRCAEFHVDRRGEVTSLTLTLTSGEALRLAEILRNQACYIQKIRDNG